MAGPSLSDRRLSGACRRALPSRKRRRLVPYTGAIPLPPTARGAALERPVRRLRRSDHDRRGDPRGGREFPICLAQLWPQAARRGVSRATFLKYTGLAHARPAHHGSARQPAGIHQFGLGLPRHAGERDAHRKGPRLPRASTAPPSRRSSAPTASTAIPSRRSGAWKPISARSVGDRPVIRSTATLACVGRRQAYFRGEFLAALDILQGGTSGRTVWSVPGPAPSARPNSCRPRSSASRSTSTATAAAMWSTACRTSSPPPPTI